MSNRVFKVTTKKGKKDKPELISHKNITFKKPQEFEDEKVQKPTIPEDPEEFFKNQMVLMNEFVEAIRTKQLEKLFTLAQTNEITLEGKKYKKRSLTASQHKEIVKLDAQVPDEENYIKRTEILIDLRTKCGKYYFGIEEKVVDKHYEELQDILDACMLKSYTGINPDDINFKQMLEVFKKRYDNSILQNKMIQ